MDNINKITNILKSKMLVVIICIVFGLALLVGAFSLGTMVGYHKARFSYAWGDNYRRNFGGPRRGFMGDMTGGRDLVNSYGVSGQIIRLDGQTIIIEGSDNTERTVLIKADTLLRKSRDVAMLGDLKPNDYVVVIGEPTNDGQLVAKLIRILPSPMMPSTMPIPRQ